MAPNAWNAEAVRDLLVAMAMHDSSSKPQPKWDRVEKIMTDLGYNFTASAMSQHFSKKIWKDTMQKRGQLQGSPSSTPAATSGAATPRSSRKRSAPSSAASSTRKRQYTLQGTELDTDDDWDAQETPSKKPKVKPVVKKEAGQKQGSSKIIPIDDEDSDNTLDKEEDGGAV